MTHEAPHAWKEAIAELPPDGIDTAACPDTDRIWSAVRGELSPDVFGWVADHAAGCPACALAWQLAEKAVEEIGPAEIPAETPVARPSWRAWYGLAAAAILIAAVTAVIQFRGTTPVTVDPGYRAPVEETIRSELPPGGTLARDAFTLVWSGPEGASFDVQLADRAFQTIYRTEGVTESHLTVPAEALKNVPEGAVLVWQIAARMPDGTRELSRTFEVTVR